MKGTYRLICAHGLILFLGVLVGSSFILPAPAPSQTSGVGSGIQGRSRSVTDVPDSNNPSTPPGALSSKQKRDIVQSNFDKTKSDAEQLAAMANELRDELNKTSANILSLDVIGKAEKIEKLAKKIKDEAKGE